MVDIADTGGIGAPDAGLAGAGSFTQVNAGATGQQLQNIAEVAEANEPDIDSEPETDGDLDEDDEAEDEVNVRAPRPISKRDLLASSDLSEGGQGDVGL